MGRRLFNLAAAMSLVLCVAIAVLWIRGFVVVDNYAFADADGDYLYQRYVSNYRGVILYTGIRYSSHAYGTRSGYSNDDPPGWDDIDWKLLGFRASGWSPTEYRSIWMTCVQMPHWC